MPRALKVVLLQLPHPLYPLANLPLASGYLKAAAHAENLADVDIEILNTTVSTFDQMGDGSIIRKIVERKPDMLGITVFLWNCIRSLELCKRIKKIMPNALIIAGGPEVAPKSLGTILEEGVDIVVWGMGELAFVEILKMLRQQERTFWKIPGVYTGNRGNILGSGNALIPNYAFLPSPYVMEYFDLARYSVFPLFTMQGCRGRCKYCSWGGRGPLKAFPKRRVIDELSMFKAFKDICIYIMDSAFNNSPIFGEVCTAIGRNSLTDHCRVECFADASRITSAQTKMLSIARMSNVEVGVQSLNPSALSAIGRNTDPEMLMSDIENLSASGISSCVDVILGLPGDDLNGFRSTMNRLENLPVGKHVFNLSIAPATKLRSEARKWGLEYQEEPPYYVLGTSRFAKEQIETAFFEFSDFSSDYEKGYADILYYPQSIIHEGTVSRFPIWKKDIPFIQIICFEGDKSVQCALDPVGKVCTDIAAVAGHYVSIVFRNVTQGLALATASSLVRLILTQDPYAAIDIVLEFSSIAEITSVDDLLAFSEATKDKPRAFLDYRNYFLAKTRKILRSGSINLILVLPPNFPIPRQLENVLRICWAIDVESAISPEKTVPSSCLAQSKFLLINSSPRLTGGALLSTIARISDNKSGCNIYFKDWGAQCLLDASIRNVAAPMSFRQEMSVSDTGDLLLSEYSSIEIVRRLLNG